MTAEGMKPGFWDNLVPLKGGLFGDQLAGWTPGPPAKAGPDFPCLARNGAAVGQQGTNARRETVVAIMRALPVFARGYIEHRHAERTSTFEAH